MTEQKSNTNIDRRNFISVGAAAGAGLIMSNVVRSQQNRSSSEDLNIAILGTELSYYSYDKQSDSDK